MGRKKPALFLLKSRNRTAAESLAYGTGAEISQSGIYRVVHETHRLPHEVTLLRDERFPKCSQCHDAVVFEFVRPVAISEEALLSRPQIHLYELPVLDDEQDVAV